MWLTTDQFNFVPALPAAFYDSTVTTMFPCKIVNMAKYDSMVAIISLNDPSTMAIWVNAFGASTGLVPSSATTCGAGAASVSTQLVVTGNYRTSNSTGTGNTEDTLSARTALATTAIAVTAATTAKYNMYIEIKAADLPAGYPYCAVTISSSATASTGIAVNYIMKPRYLNLNMSTALS
jgi:hypothetical protein